LNALLKLGKTTLELEAGQLITKLEVPITPTVVVPVMLERIGIPARLQTRMVALPIAGWISSGLSLGVAMAARSDKIIW